MKTESLVQTAIYDVFRDELRTGGTRERLGEVEVIVRYSPAPVSWPPCEGTLAYRVAEYDRLMNLPDVEDWNMTAECAEAQAYGRFACDRKHALWVERIAD